MKQYPSSHDTSELAAPIPDISTDDAGLTRRETVRALCLGLAIAGVAAGIAFATGKSGKTAMKPLQLRHLSAFSLTERTGRTITQADVAGKILVVNFIFTSCSLSCRVVNDRMEEIQRRLGDANDVQLLSLTVDPRTDTPSVLAKFADGFHADTNRWLFLTGDKAELYRLLETSFIPRSSDLATLIPGGFTGTDRIVLVNAEGNVCASFDGLGSHVANSVISEIENLRKNRKPL